MRWKKAKFRFMQNDTTWHCFLILPPLFILQGIAQEWETNMDAIKVSTFRFILQKKLYQYAWRIPKSFGWCFNLSLSDFIVLFIYCKLKSKVK